jgi:hypothetical protein
MRHTEAIRWPVLIFWAFWLALAILLLHGG